MKLNSVTFATFTTMTTLMMSSVAFSAALAPNSFKDSSTSSFSATHNAGGGITIQTTETRYLTNQGPMLTMLKAATTTTFITNGEGADVSTTLEMRGNDTGLLDKVLWSATSEGGDANYLNDEMVSVTEEGCCGSEKIIRLFNAMTGAKIEAAVRQVYQIELPNSPTSKRYLSLAVDSKAPRKSGSKNYVGTISYYSAEKIIARARIYAAATSNMTVGFNDTKLMDGDKEADDKTVLQLWGSNGRSPAKAYGGFSFDAEILYSTKAATVHVAISNDTIDEATSKVSGDLAIQFVK